MTFNYKTTVGDLSVLVGGLELLESQLESKYVFQDKEWAEVWLGTYGTYQGVTPVVFEITCCKTKARLSFPLAIRKLGPGIRILTVLGGFHADYSGVQITGDVSVFDPVACWTAIENWAIANKIDLISIPRIPISIDQTANPMAMPGLLPCESSGQICLPFGWKDFFDNRFKTRVKSDIRRQIKRISLIGKLSFRYAKTLDEALALTNAMIDQKRTRYNDMGITDQFKNSEAKLFYIRLTEALWSKGVVHAAGLFVGDELIATHWGAKFRNRFYYLMPAHLSGNWTKYSPGKILLQYLVEHAANSGCTVFDLTVGGESYKDDWCDNYMRLVRYEKSITLTGRLLTVGLRIRKLLQQKKLKKPRTT